MAEENSLDESSGKTSAQPGADASLIGSADIFISYASADRAAAEAICAALEKAGIGCWIAPRDVVPGQSYASAIVHAIDATKVIVLVLSEHGAASQHVLREVERATSKRHPVVAFRIDLAPMPADLEYFLNTSQWLDASALGVERALPKLVDAVQRAVATKSVPSPGDTGSTQKPATRLSQQSPVAKRASRGPSRVVLAFGVLVTLGLAYVAVDKFWLGKHMERESPTAATTNAVSDTSIAVLPFTDMSEKKDQEYLADGISEEIIYLLAKIPNLRVIGRTSSFQFKGKSEDLRKIGTALGAAFVVEGSVRRFSNRVRVSAQLIDARDGSPRWSETYDRDVSDALTLQDEITSSLARALQLELSNTVVLAAPGLQGSAEAHEAFLRGLHSFNRFDEPGFEDAVADFKRALELAPTFVPAAEQLARTYCDQPSWGFLPPAIGYERARTAANAVLKLDPHSSVGHTVLACVYLWYDWNWAAARQESELAMKAAPRDVFTLVVAAEYHQAVGEWSDAVRLCEAAKTFDPLTASIFQNAGQVYLRWGRYAEAESSARRVLQISSTYAGGHSDLGRALIMGGKATEALTEMQNEPVEEFRLGGLALAFEALHRNKEALAALQSLVSAHAADAAFAIAEAYSYGGQKDKALEWLERAYVQKDILLWGIKDDPFLKGLKEDHRYLTFLRKINLQE